MLPKGDRALGAKVITTILLSLDVLNHITSYQQGIRGCFLPLELKRDQVDVLRAKLQRAKVDSMFERLVGIYSPWCASSSQLVKLVETLPYLAQALVVVAVYTGNMQAIQTLEAAGKLVVWDGGVVFLCVVMSAWHWNSPDEKAMQRQVLDHLYNLGHEAIYSKRAFELAMELSERHGRIDVVQALQQVHECSSRAVASVATQVTPPHTPNITPMPSISSSTRRGEQAARHSRPWNITPQVDTTCRCELM
ncbi:hypothetical protein AeMF1_006407 [Aphanomyces euteiches]|nr:hypothetical protein AeMF1_006407 [Aphanomyces euteiches]KAH9183264.1 hypothetical protein AeNC1_014760 [Aphanomyces euteiches]